MTAARLPARWARLVTRLASCALFAAVGGVPRGSAAQPVAPGAGRAQAPRDSLGPALSLDDAEQIAHQSNPTYLESLVALRSSNAAVRTAWGGLLPQVSASFGAQYQEAGQELLSGVTFGIPSNILASNYQVGLTYQLNAATLLTPAYARASRAAADADVGSQAAALRNAVAQQYLTALATQARTTLEDTLIADARIQLALARARETVGSATPLDVRRAEIALGQQQVEALQVRNQAAVDLLHLFQQMGVAQPPGVRLSSAFAVSPPGFSLDTVLALARADNPDLTALRARAHAANVGVHRAHGLYVPTLTVNTGIGGYTYQYTNPNVLVAQSQGESQQLFGLCSALDTTGRSAAGFPSACSSLLLSPAQIAQIRASNRVFPFNFTNVPRQISATLSLPLFDGFAREQHVEEASAAEDDARYAVRARELQLTADVTSAFYTLTTALETAQLQADNAAKAREELLLVEERYRVGAASFLDVADSRAAFARTETDRINAVYDYHKAFAALENAVGRRLQ